MSFPDSTAVFNSIPSAADLYDPCSRSPWPKRVLIAGAIALCALVVVALVGFTIDKCNAHCGEWLNHAFTDKLVEGMTRIVVPVAIGGIIVFVVGLVVQTKRDKLLLIYISEHQAVKAKWAQPNERENDLRIYLQQEQNRPYEIPSAEGSDT